MTGVGYAATAVDALRATPNALRVDDTSYISGLSCMAEAIHEGGAKAGIQISPGGGAQAEGTPWMPGLQGIGNSPDEFAAVIKSGIPKWAKVIKDAGIKPD